MQQKVGKLRRQAVTCRIAVELRDQPIEAPPRRGRNGIFAAGAKNFVGGRGLGDQPFDGGEPFVRLALELAGQPSQPAQDADALDFTEKTSRVPAPSGSSSKTELERRNGRWKTRVWLSRRFPATRRSLPPTSVEGGPTRTVARRWTRPWASARSLTM